MPCVLLVEPKSKECGERPSKKRKGCGGCPYHKQEAMVEFRDRALVGGAVSHATLSGLMLACGLTGFLHILLKLLLTAGKSSTEQTGRSNNSDCILP